MKKKFKSLLFLSALFGSFVVIAEIREVVVLQTTDIHGHVSDYGKANWLKIASVIQDERRSIGKDNVLLVDCGDTTQGTFESAFEQSEMVINLMNALDYDIWIPGNHEFDFGIKTLINRIKQCQFQVLLGNVEYKGLEKLVHPWHMFERGKLKIAVIGGTLSDLMSRQWGSCADGIKVESLRKMVSRYMPDIMDSRPDIIVLAVHNGSYPGPDEDDDNIRKIARDFPQIDLVLGGHIHQACPGVKIGPETWYVSAGKHAEFLAKIRIIVDTTRQQVVDIKSTLIASKSMPECGEIREKIASELDQASKYSKKVIGKVNKPILPTKEGEFYSSMNRLFGEAIAKAVDADIVFHGTLNPSKKLYGSITEKDLFDVAPYENLIGVIELTPDEIKQVLEEQLRVSRRQGTTRFSTPWGLRAKFNPKKAIVESICRPSGEPFPEGEKLKVAFNSYTLAGAGGRYPILKKFGSSPSCHPVDTGKHTRDILRNFFKKK